MSIGLSIFSVIGSLMYGINCHLVWFNLLVYRLSKIGFVGWICNFSVVCIKYLYYFLLSVHICFVSLYVLFVPLMAC